jgi:hypothetical protein
MAILGQVTIDEIAIYSVSVDPSGDGFPAAIGSIASLDDDTNAVYGLSLEQLTLLGLLFLDYLMQLHTHRDLFLLLMLAAS